MTGETVIARPMEARIIVTSHGMVLSPQPVRKVSDVAALAAHPGKALGKIAPRAKIIPQGFQKWLKPFRGFTPVPRLWRSFPMLGRYSPINPPVASQHTPPPACVVM